MNRTLAGETSIIALSKQETTITKEIEYEKYKQRQANDKQRITI